MVAALRRGKYKTETGVLTARKLLINKKKKFLSPWFEPRKDDVAESIFKCPPVCA